MRQSPADPAVTRAAPRTVARARTAVAVVFALNGFAFASWMSRIPEARAGLGLSAGELGTLLLALSTGSVLGLPSAGIWVHRFGAARVVTAASVVDAVGLAIAGLGAGALDSAMVTAGGLFLLGLGSGTWDVAMNIEGAAVERALGWTVMPRFHAAFSVGTVAGAAAGAVASAAGLPMTAHLGAAAVPVAVVPALAVRFFLAPDGEEEKAARSHPLRAWREPRTLILGVLVLAMALTEGVANDWLAVALVDGYDVPAWVGASGFALFVAAMTGGRVAGTGVLDRYGRVRVLWASIGLGATGVVLVVLGPGLAESEPAAAGLLAGLGVLLWGVGASLGFPVGMSAAADEAQHAAGRVSVVSTIGYSAFLAGPPLLGFLGDRVGVLSALLVVAVLLLPSALAVPAARELRGDSHLPAKRGKLGLP